MYKEQTIAAEPAIGQEEEVYALDCSFQPLAAPPVSPRKAGFQLPRGVWTTMLTCYATFFAALFAATGGSGTARFAIAICVLYTAVYFGVARICARQAGVESRSPLEQGKSLPTWTGPMDRKGVYGQILIVPLTVALFGIGALAIIVFTSTSA